MVNSCMIHNRSVRLAFDASFLVIFVNIYLSSVVFIHQYSHPQFSKHCSAVHLCFYFFQYGIYSFPASIALTTSVLRIFLNQHSKCVLLQIYFCALIEGGKIHLWNKCEGQSPPEGITKIGWELMRFAVSPSIFFFFSSPCHRVMAGAPAMTP